MLRLACPQAADGPGRNDGSSLRSHRLPRGHRPPMTSSPMAAARCQHLLDLLAQVPDPRKKRGRRPALAGLLAVGIAAVIAGSKSVAAIGQSSATNAAARSGLDADFGRAEEKMSVLKSPFY